MKLHKAFLLVLPFSLIVYLILPERTIYEIPVSQSATLADSIPIAYYQRLQVVEKQGNKFFENGKVVTYLEYNTKAAELLKTIGSLPFPMYAMRADTVCVETGFYAFNKIKNSISTEEQKAGAYFWNIEPSDYQVFECIKGHEKHTLLISRNSEQVLHRIEYSS